MIQLRRETRPDKHEQATMSNQWEKKNSSSFR